MKKIIILTLSILMIFTLASCSKNEESSLSTNNAAAAADSAQAGDSSVIISTDEEYSSEQESTEPEPVATATPVPRATAGESEDVTYKSNIIEIVYNNPEDGQTYTENYDAGENAGADAALNAVNELILSGTFGNIGVNNVVKTGSNVFIDFDESVYNLEKDPLLEYPSLEAIADAYLNNVDGVTGVYFTVNGSGYTSMNLEYDADEPFKIK